MFSKRTTILFYPDVTKFGFVAYRLCRFLRYRITNDPTQQYDVAFKRKDGTRTDPAALNDLPMDVDRIINSRSHDISKNRVDAVQEEVFSYPTAVDPTTHQGEALKKSDENALRDCEIITCPIPEDSVDPDYVYQKLINNETGDDQTLDYRVTIIGNQIPAVVLKYHPLKRKRFVDISGADLATADSVFNDEEQAKILEFARAMGIDFGEFDVLRDVDDDRIYIVDTNNTPYGPTGKLGWFGRRAALKLMAPAFRDLIDRFRLGETETS